MSRSLLKTVMLVVDLDLRHALNLRCNLVVLRTVTSFLTSTLALVFALAVAHFESRNLVTK